MRHGKRERKRRNPRLAREIAEHALLWRAAENLKQDAETHGARDEQVLVDAAITLGQARDRITPPNMLTGTDGPGFLTGLAFALKNPAWAQIVTAAALRGQLLGGDESHYLSSSTQILDLVAAMVRTDQERRPYLIDPEPVPTVEPPNPN